jgi:hypothetical protein
VQRTVQCSYSLHAAHAAAPSCLPCCTLQPATAVLGSCWTARDRFYIVISIRPYKLVQLCIPSAV